MESELPVRTIHDPQKYARERGSKLYEFIPCPECEGDIYWTSSGTCVSCNPKTTDILQKTKKTKKTK